jgi:hypothetical protein
VKNYTPETKTFSESIPIVEISDTNHADNVNASPKRLIENDNYLKGKIDDSGLEVVDGALCVTFDE